MTAKNLVNLERKEFKKFLSSFDYVLSDCDGVLWLEGPLPEAGKFLNTLRSLGKKVFFITNNSVRNFKESQEKFGEIGINLKEDDIYYPSKTISDYLKSINFNKKVFALAWPEAIEVLERHGFECETGPNNAQIIEHPSDCRKFSDDESIGAVVMDTDFWVNYPKLHKATIYLKRPDVLFIQGAVDKTMTGAPGDNVIGPGYFNNIIEEFTKRKPIVLGKPGVHLLKHLKNTIAFEDSKRVLFIGDMLDTDIAFGKAGGFQTLLVTTTFTIDEAVDRCMIPDYYTTALGDIVPQLILNNK